jgi:acetyl esterase/lipase
MVAHAQDTPATDEPEKHFYLNESGDSLSAYVFRASHGSAGTTGAVVLFHGGGWTIGEPSWAFSRARHLASLGLVAVAAEYRLSNKNGITPTDAMADARAALRWVRSNASDLGVLPNRILAYGWSAGAHLAACAVLFADSAIADSVSAVPDALILVSPALDLEGDDWVRSLLGPDVAAASISPANHVRKGMPPTLILIGETDTVTPLTGAQLFRDRMLAAGNKCEMEVYPGVGHLFTPASMRDDLWPQPDSAISAQATARTSEFLRSLGYIK